MMSIFEKNMNNRLASKIFFGALALSLAGVSAHATISVRSADSVLGEPNFTTGAGGVTATTLSNNRAFGVAGFANFFNGAALDSSGNVWLADYQNDRVLMYPAPVGGTLGQAATVVLGQASLTTGGAGTTATTLNGPSGLTFDSSGNLWVSDTLNERVLKYPKANLVTGGAATVAIGQGSLTTATGGTTATTLYYPTGLTFDGSGNLWVADTDNERVLLYPAAAQVTGGAATQAIGQGALTTGTAGTTATTLNGPSGLAFDSSGNLWVADNANDRVLKYPAAAQVTGGAATVAVGVPSLTSSAGGTTATTLYKPFGLAFDSAGNLWVADTSNERVVAYPPANQVTGGTALVVLGQANNFTTGTTGTTATTLNGPTGLAFDGSGNMWVSDAANDRALEFQNPLSSSPFNTVLTSTAIAFNWNIGAASLSDNSIVVLTTTTFLNPVSSVTVNASGFPISTAAYPGTGGLSTVLANTTYFFQVKDSTQADVDYTTLPGTVTLANVPAASAANFSNIGSSGVTVSWFSNGNPLNVTTYTLVFSSVPSLAVANQFIPFLPLQTGSMSGASGGSPANQDPATLISFTSATNAGTNGSYASTLLSVTSGFAVGPLAGLAPNTSYWAYVDAINYLGIPSTFTSLGAFATLAVPATGFFNNALASTPTYTNFVTSSVVQVRWSSGTALTGWNSLPGLINRTTPAPNAVGTTYSVVLATTGVVSTFTGNSGNVTLSTTPVSVNGGVVQAGVELAATLSALSGNTTYWVYVAAQNVGNGQTLTAYNLISSVTVEALPPGTAAESSVGSNSAVINLNTGKNGPTLYQITYSSTDPTLSVAGSTFTAYIQPGSTFTAVSGLAPGANYFVKATAISYNGNTNNTATNMPIFTTAGGLAIPTGLTFTDVEIGSMTVQWSLVSNVSTYTVVIATDSTFGTITTKATVLTPPANSSGTVTFGPPGVGTGLSPNINYFVVVQSTGGAVGANAGLTSQASTAISTFTLPAAPSGSAVAIFSANMVGASSATFTWNVGSAGAGLPNPPFTLASIERSSASPSGGFTNTFNFTTAVSSVVTPALAGGNSGSYTDTTLVGCSTYAVHIRNLSGSGAFSQNYDATLNFRTQASTPTPPVGFIAAPQANNQIALTWTVPPTEGITGYNLYWDSGTGTYPSTGAPANLTYGNGIAAAAPHLLNTFVSSTSFTMPGVNSSTTPYIFAITAVHRCGVESGPAFSLAASTSGVASVRASISAPVAGALLNGGSTASGGSNAITVAANLVSGTPASTSFVEFQFKTPAASSWTVIAAARSLPYAVLWDPSPTGFNLPNNNADPGGFNCAALAGGQPSSAFPNACLYFLRAVAYDLSGTSDTFAAGEPVSLIPTQNPNNLTTASNATLATLAAGAGFLSGTSANAAYNATVNIANPAAIVLTQVLADQTTAVFSAAAPGTSNLVTITAGPGTFGGVPFVSVFSPNPIANTVAAVAGEAALMPFGYKPVAPDAVNAPTTPLAMKLSLYGTALPGCTLTGISSCNFPAGKVAQLAVTYKDANNTGTIDGTNPPVRADAVKILSRCEAAAGCPYNADVAMLAPDTNKHIIYGLTSHATLFNVAGIPAANLSSVRVYPNPWKPNGSDPNQGQAVPVGQIPGANQGIVFDNLPANFTIKIYTVAGTLVATKTVGNGQGTGTVVWDGTNDAGRGAASGAYFAVISAPGVSTIVKRLAIVR